MSAPIRFLCALGFLTLIHSAAAQGIIWNGPSIDFVNVSGSDWSQPSSQDRLTSDVWLTRGPTRGLFNAALESGFTSFVSPVGTEWAFGTLDHYASLQYATWETWNSKDPPAMVGRDAVVHLVSDDIYLSIRFTFWGFRGSGFSYTRSTELPVPEPSTAAIAVLGFTAVALFRAKRI
jgi:hypothetical protein